MHNKALEDSIYALAAGAFGVFLRWLQLQLAFDENGLCGQSVFNWIVPLFILAVAFVLRRRARDLLDSDYVLPDGFAESLANPGKAYAFFRWVPGALMMLGGALMIRSSEVARHVFMVRLLGALAILSGVCFPLLLTLANRELKDKRRWLLCLLSLPPILLFSAWLVFDYMENAINSVIWGYLIEVLAVSALLLGFYRLAGFAYGVVVRKKSLFWLQFGVVMSLIVLADERKTGMQAVFFAAGLMLLLADFIWLRKLHEKEPEKDAEEEAPAPAPASIGFEKL